MGLVALVVTSVLAGGSIDAASSRNVRRLGGLDRYETAVEVSKAFHPSRSSSVILATGQNFADSLSGSALAARLDAPLLLATWGTIPQITQREIQRLGATRVIVLGGTSALSQIVEAQLPALGVKEVIRLSGSDRYETSAEISKFGWPTITSFSSRKVYLASGQEYGPGLIAGAAAGRTDSPVLLSKVDRLPVAVAQEISRLKPSEIFQVGYGSGYGNLSSVVGNTATSLVGATRRVFYESSLVDLSATVAEYTPSRGRSAPVVLLVTAENFPDALSAGAAAGTGSIPLLMTWRACLPSSVNSQMNLYGVSNLLVVGQTSAISDSASSGVTCGGSSSPTPAPIIPAPTTAPVNTYRTTCYVSLSIASTRTSPSFIVRLIPDSNGTRVPALYSRSFSYTIYSTSFSGTDFGSSSVNEAQSAFGGVSVGAYFPQASSVTSWLTYSISVNFGDGAACSASGSPL